MNQQEEQQRNVRTHAIDPDIINKPSNRAMLDNEKICIEVNNFSFYYGHNQALKSVNLKIPEKSGQNPHVEDKWRSLERDCKGFEKCTLTIRKK